MVKVYLAGSVYETGYRDYAYNNYSKKLDICDPLREVEAGIMGLDLSSIKDLKKINFTKDEICRIIELDKQAISSCDILVAYIRRCSFGTTMEILYAWQQQIPVYVINPGNTFIKDVWLSYHTTRFHETIDECFEYIISSIE